ncbi:MAG: type VI secretion system tube protein Hcp [Gammaproteobacteria bacterium]|nr:type VI secretion system tube protein Hcp [Gammaproteobacteria bacterium]
MSIFLNYEGIQGESSDQGHAKWIDVDSWSWGVARQITSSTSTQNDRESTNAKITDLTITKRMDSSSPKLFLESCCGTGKNVILHLSKTGSGTGSDVYQEYKLKNALISHYSVGGNATDKERPTESITISFVELESKYTPYDEDGKATSPIAVGFDTAKNVKK